MAKSTSPFTASETLLVATSTCLLTIASAILVAGCATDGIDDESRVEESITTKYDECAVNHAANAMEDVTGSFETYTRKGDPTINYDCDCLDWQKDARDHGEAQANIDHPLCRPETIVNMKWEVWYPVLAWEVRVPSWSLTNGEIECLNSKLVVSYWKETSPGTFTFQFSQTKQPTMLADGTCSSISLGGSGTADGNRYRIKALATRGLDDKNHGFETVKVTGSTFNF